MNNLTYGWWQNGTIYRYTDPDNMTLIKGGTYNAAQSRVNAAAISGTVFMSSDNVGNHEAQELMKALLTNRNVNEIAVLTDVWTGSKTEAKQTLSVALEAGQSKAQLQPPAA